MSVKISALPAGAAASTDEIAANQSGTTRKITAGATAALNSDNSIGVSTTRCASQGSITTALALKEDTISLTASRAVASTAGGALTVSTTTAAELDFVSGVTSAIQTQIDNHLADTTTHGTTTAIVGIGDAQTITNKILDGGTASATSQWNLPTDTTTNLDVLADVAGDIAYDSTTGRPVFNDSTGWQVFEDGDVVGPSSAVDNGIAVYDSTTGKLIKDSTITAVKSGSSISIDGTSAGTQATSVGTSSSAAGNDSVAVGAGASAATTGNVAVGQGAATTTGASNIAIGDGASTTSSAGGVGIGGGVINSGTDSVSVGDASTTTATDGVAVGNTASVSGANSVSIGANTSSGSSNNISLGDSATVGTSSNASIALNCQIPNSTANTFGVGSNSAPVTTAVIGSGLDDATPQSTTTLRTTDGVGTDIAATDLIVQAGRGTGSAAPGTLSLRTSRAGGSSSTVQTATDDVVLDGLGNVELGAQVADAATDGFVYIPTTTAGPPSGTPTSKTGLSPIVVDDTNDDVWFYSSGAWRKNDANSFGREIFVDPSGSADETTIAAAITAASALTPTSSDAVKIYLSAGTHNVDNSVSTPVLPQDVYIIGSGTDSTRITASSSARATIECRSRCGISNVKLNLGFGYIGFRIDSNGVNRDAGVVITNIKLEAAATAFQLIDGKLLINNMKTDNFGAVTVVDATAVTFASSCVIENCTFADIVNIILNTGAGFDLTATVTKCLVTRTAFGNGRLFVMDSGTLISSYNTWGGTGAITIYQLSGTATLQDDYCTETGVYTNNFVISAAGVTVVSNYGKYDEATFSLTTEDQRPNTYFDTTSGVFINKSDSKSFVDIPLLQWAYMFGGNS
jgi:hypothetical protein